MTDDLTAPGCVSWSLYSRDTGVFPRVEKHCATVLEYGKPAKRFLPAIAVVGRKSFIHTEDARREFQIYLGEYVRKALLGAPIEGAAEIIDVVYDRGLDNGSWAGANL